MCIVSTAKVVTNIPKGGSMWCEVVLSPTTPDAPAAMSLATWWGELLSLERLTSSTNISGNQKTRISIDWRRTRTIIFLTCITYDIVVCHALSSYLLLLQMAPLGL
jgi:hypothetical protein